MFDRNLVCKLGIRVPISMGVCGSRVGIMVLKYSLCADFS